MSISVNLLINHKNDTTAVKELIEALGFDTEVEPKVDYAFITVSKNKQKVAMFYVAKTQEYGGLDATVISASSREETIDILKRIQKVTGGFLQKNDNTSFWTAKQDPHRGNMRWVLEHQIRKKLIDSDSKEFIEAVYKATGYK